MTKDTQLVGRLNLAMLVLILIGAFFTWEKNNDGQDFLDNYVKEQTKWMILDMILFAILLILVFLTRGQACQRLYVLTLILFVLMKMMHLHNAQKIQSSDKPSGGSKAHLNDLFYGTLFDGFVLGIASCYLVQHYSKK